LKPIEIVEEALEEAEQAARRYENESPALRASFLEHLDEGMRWLATNPEAFPPAVGVPARIGARRIALKRFPYGIIFVERGERVRVLAIAHDRREPGYWRQRAQR
jgi:plasmid stabilization system protein ParE